MVSDSIECKHERNQIILNRRTEIDNILINSCLGSVYVTSCAIYNWLNEINSV